MMTMTARAPVAARSPVQLEVERARALVKARRFGEAIAAATRLASDVPENRDVLYRLALASYRR